MTDNPDKVQLYTVTHCRQCGASLPGKAESIERRQVVDIPPLKLEATEHQAECKTCKICGARNKPAFPEGVNQSVQYGPQIKALGPPLDRYGTAICTRRTEKRDDLRHL
jgi:ribosomal protein L40E